MKVEVRNDRVEIRGYVNITMRDSKPIWSKGGKFLEQINRGVFKRALESAQDVEVLLNHDENRKLSSRNKGFEMREDDVGLYVEGEITDDEVVSEARAGKLSGFSFGFICIKETREEIDKDGCKERRYVEEMDLKEISILNYKKKPAYSGCLIETRSEDGKEICVEYRCTEFDVADKKTKYDNSSFRERLEKIRK